MSFKRRIKFRPAFDRRDPDPNKDYGIHGLEMQFQLIGPEGGVTFTIFTNWMLPHVQAEMDAKPPGNGHLRYMFHKPQPAGCDGHFRKPGYEGQNPIAGCDITGGDCYCDGTSLTEDLFDLLLAEGEEPLWKRLEERYESWRPK